METSCNYCGSIKNIQIDHIIPVSRGGQDIGYNRQLLCASCNKKKGSSEIGYHNLIMLGYSHESSKKKFPNKETKRIKPTREKKQRFNFTFQPSFIDEIDKYLEENPHEGTSRSAFLFRCASIHINKK